MTRFHLHISADGHEDPDAEGHDFTDLRQAVAAAGKTAGELLFDALQEKLSETTIQVQVCDSDNGERALITAQCVLR